MSDIFISYANEDREQARLLAEVFESHGWSVWWDRKIKTGQTFDQVIEHELEIAKSVVVLWSKYSITSEWVKNEAAVAAERGVLVPALIDNIKLPLEFRRRQSADLIGWDGKHLHEGFQALCDGIGIATDIKSKGAGHTSFIARTSIPHRKKLRWFFYGLTVIIAVVSFGLYKNSQFFQQQDTPEIANSEISLTSGPIRDNNQQTKIDTNDIPSTNIDEPKWLSSNEIRGEGTGEHVSHYYTFIAEPGTVKVTADAKNGFGGIANALGVVLMDMDANKLLELNLGNTKIDKRVVERIKINRQQQIIMRILLDKVTIDYMVRVEGAVNIGPVHVPSNNN